MKRLFLVAMLVLAACAAQTQLTASQTFGKAQIVFKSLQQLALTCITNQVKQCVDNKVAIIDAADKGQIAETAGYTAQQAHSQPGLQQATTDLSAAITALQTLGVK